MPAGSDANGVAAGGATSKGEAVGDGSSEGAGAATFTYVTAGESASSKPADNVTDATDVVECAAACEEMVGCLAFAYKDGGKAADACRMYESKGSTIKAPSKKFKVYKMQGKKQSTAAGAGTGAGRQESQGSAGGRAPASTGDDDTSTSSDSGTTVIIGVAVALLLIAAVVAATVWYTAKNGAAGRGGGAKQAASFENPMYDTPATCLVCVSHLCCALWLPCCRWAMAHAGERAPSRVCACVHCTSVYTHACALTVC